MVNYMNSFKYMGESVWVFMWLKCLVLIVRGVHWCVCWFTVFGIFCIAFVPNISDVAIVVIGRVGDDLSATIGQQDAVLTTDVSLVISGCLMGVVVVSVVILYSPSVFVRHRGLLVITKLRKDKKKRFKKGN